MNKGIVSRIQTIVDHLEISVSAFADEIGVQRSSMSHLLNGRNKPSLDFVMKLVDTYPEVDLYWLLKGEGSFPKERTKPETTYAPFDGQSKEDDNTPPLEPLPVQTSQSSSNAKEPQKIVMFYIDGTFEVFQAKKD